MTLKVVRGRVEWTTTQNSKIKHKKPQINGPRQSRVDHLGTHLRVCLVRPLSPTISFQN